jgi:multidrug efflux pump subunit AcrA (membrane-fusion protein)
MQLAQQKATAAKDAEGPTAAELAQAKVSIENAQVNVDDAEDGLEETKLTAPFAGTILTLAGAEGDGVSGGTSSSTSGSSSSETSSNGTGSTGTSSTGSTSSSSSSSSSAFITMASMSALEVTATIAEADIGTLKVGQEAEVTLSASEETMTGTVSAVSPEGTTSNNVVQYPVTVSVTDPPASARLGASVSVTVTTGSVQDALILPTNAITTTGTRSSVLLLKQGVATPTVIETGLESSSTTEITSGLAAGDVVQIPVTTTTSSSGVPGFGGGPGGPARGIGGGGR